ncbi:MAG: tail fiber domain-containing protein [Paludibacteraceae bacterium]|nr:tail fiber domain-containing protein [Paludibacteraceae bacterium]
MKKHYLILLLLLSTMTSIYAQLHVSSIGNVGIGIEANDSSKLRIHTAGNYFYGLASTSNVSTSQWAPALYGKTSILSGRQAAMLAAGASSQPLNHGRSYGLVAYGGNRTPGYNYGVLGILVGSNNGTGICGTTTENVPKINGKYAGYFVGNTYVTGTMTAQTYTTISDVRCKKNIQDITSHALINIKNLNPVQYNMSSTELTSPVMSDTTHMTELNGVDTFDDTKTHYGLLAQEVQKIYPELVYSDDAGMLSINYIELIPLLIQSIQDLASQVEELQGVSKRMMPSTITSSSEDMQTILYQNNPNPFSLNTTIAYEIPTTASRATLYIYDMNGTQIKSIPIQDFGHNSVTLQGNSMKAGMYLYSLVVDGVVIDTKRMILTE